jgi:folate-dependent phosphoribosylglycinamide formyltransferase PurN
MSRLTWLLRHAWDARVWRPEHGRLLWLQVAHRNRNLDAGLADVDHLKAAVEWLSGAQDARTDGGVAGRYRLRGGWTSSYPETTGYIIPTLLALADEQGDSRFHDRAGRCAGFLLGLQLPDGAFPGGELHENTTVPSVFNTAQILGGLTAWHKASGARATLDAARRAADWLVSVQDPDGAWRRHVYGGVATTYSAFASCWLAEFGVYTGDRQYLDAAARHFDWVMRHYDGSTGWFDLTGFVPDAHRARQAVVHGVAYTLWGVLRSAELLDREDGLAAVETAALAAARRLELSGWLPGVVDHRWRGRAAHACLTGNAQMALVWLRLYRQGANPVFLNAALKALDLVKRAQPMFSRDPGIRGGIPGSDPVWGAYIENALPNWAAKFFIDALLEKRSVLAGVAGRPRGRWQVPATVPRSLPEPQPPSAGARPLRVVLFSTRGSDKVPKMLSQWSEWGFRPSAVVFERERVSSLVPRIIAKIKHSGMRSLVSRLVASPRARVDRAPDSGRATQVDPVAYCRAKRIPYYEVASLDSPDGRALVARLQPDLAVHAGAGILRAPLLALPRLGTLNAHMGVLPYYRGMNVAEWARFNGDPVGCSVHLVDPGIDTGPIACVRIVDTQAAASIGEVRHLVDDAQIALLGDVIRYAVRSGSLPPTRSQGMEEGRQLFRMHPEVAAVLNGELRVAAQRAPWPPSGPHKEMRVARAMTRRARRA